MEAQITIGTLFKEMPDSLMPLLTKNNRLDMIDFLEAKMKAVVTNRLEGESEMTILTKDSMAVKMDSAMNVSLYLLNAPVEYDSCKQVICMETTYTLASINERETTIKYFSVRWKPISGIILTNGKQPSSTILNHDEKVFRYKSTTEDD
jgi:hypothetical protein